MWWTAIGPLEVLIVLAIYALPVAIVVAVILWMVRRKK
jgi:hypothetical protein